MPTINFGAPSRHAEISRDYRAALQALAEQTARNRASMAQGINAALTSGADRIGNALLFAPMQAYNDRRAKEKARDDFAIGLGLGGASDLDALAQQYNVSPAEIPGLLEAKSKERVARSELQLEDEFFEQRLERDVKRTRRLAEAKQEFDFSPERQALLQSQVLREASNEAMARAAAKRIEAATADDPAVLDLIRTGRIDPRLAAEYRELGDAATRLLESPDYTENVRQAGIDRIGRKRQALASKIVQSYREPTADEIIAKSIGTDGSGRRYIVDKREGVKPIQDDGDGIRSQMERIAGMPPEQQGPALQQLADLATATARLRSMEFAPLRNPDDQQVMGLVGPDGKFYPHRAGGSGGAGGDAERENFDKRVMQVEKDRADFVTKLITTSQQKFGEPPTSDMIQRFRKTAEEVYPDPGLTPSADDFDDLGAMLVPQTRSARLFDQLAQKANPSPEEVQEFLKTRQQEFRDDNRARYERETQTKVAAAQRALEDYRLDPTPEKLEAYRKLYQEVQSMVNPKKGE